MTEETLDREPKLANGSAPLTLQRTRYRGTDIDGASLSPEGLWVRGSDLNSLIGVVPFEAAVWHLWFGRLPEAHELNAVVRRMQGMAVRYFQSGGGMRAAAAMHGFGVDMVFAAAAGLLCGVDPACAAPDRDPLGADWDADFDVLLACLVAAPYLMRAALGLPALEVEPAKSHAERVWRIASDGAEPGDPAVAVSGVDALLTAWHAGFGYITPTVLVPRCAIGTGVTLAQAIATGLMSSGPKHVGAAAEAMTWLKTLPYEEDAIDACVDAQLDSPGRLLFGFGHPLFVADPRPPHLRALLSERRTAGPALRQFDCVCRRAKARKSLNPNIDFITAATLLDVGIGLPQWGVGVALCARIAAMAAHAVERRSRPPFGVNSVTARRLLAAVPVGWL